MIDLHMHSLYSDDGEFTPQELAEKCLENGIHTMSITDHNTVRATKNGLCEAAKRHIRYIPGIEIDCTFQGTNFHVLGYDIDYCSKDFTVIEENIDEQTIRASLEMFSKTLELGFWALTENDMNEISKNCYWPGRWTGEMFAEVLLAKPEYLDHPLLQPYRPGGSRSDNPYVNFYWDYYSQGKPCFAKMQYPSMEEIVDIIHKNHGKAVLAHPSANLRGRKTQISDLLRLPFDGIEVFSSYHTMSQTAFFLQTARENGLRITCGSDFHGKTKPAIQPGPEVLLPVLPEEFLF